MTTKMQKSTTITH